MVQKTIATDGSHLNELHWWTGKQRNAKMWISRRITEATPARQDTSACVKGAFASLSLGLKRDIE